MKKEEEVEVSPVATQTKRGIIDDNDIYIDSLR